MYGAYGGDIRNPVGFRPWGADVERIHRGGGLEVKKNDEKPVRGAIRRAGYELAIPPQNLRIEARAGSKRGRSASFPPIDAEMDI